MDIKDHLANKDVKLAISVLGNEIKELRDEIKHGHYLSPQIEEIQKNINFLSNAVQKINQAFELE